ncbi:MAG: hypothetical protein HYY13_12255 [Nitrospirae bacterium]|nr:hypothetical protein [Nitrospirota bacterium]
MNVLDHPITVVRSGLRWRLVGAVSRAFVPGRVAVTIARRVYAYRWPLPPGVMEHECVHVRQFERERYLMWIRYVRSFLAGWIRTRSRQRAYAENPYEVEACERADQIAAASRVVEVDDRS